MEIEKWVGYLRNQLEVYKRRIMQPTKVEQQTEELIDMVLIV